MMALFELAPLGFECIVIQIHLQLIATQLQRFLFAISLPFFRLDCNFSNSTRGMKPQVIFRLL